MPGERSERSHALRSRALLAQAERDRLERVLLMLPRGRSGLGVTALAGTLARAACELSGARVAIVVLPELLGEAVVYGPDASRVGRGWPAGELGVLEAALRGETVHLADLGDDDDHTRGGALGAYPVLARTTDGRRLRCVLAVPLELGGRECGAVVLAHHRANAFSARQIRLLEALAAHLGSEIELGEQVAAASRVSTALQESLLPPLLPPIEGVELAARYRPSGSGNLVGGDFYDVFSDGAGGWYVLLGDASGVGPEAAGLAGIARYTARALASSSPAPEAMLAELNVALLRAAPEGRFCTAVLAQLSRAGYDRSGLHVRLASAGHPPAFVQRRNGRIETAGGGTGALLGVLESAAIGRCELHLAAGDAAVFYTDGVTEARNAAGEQFDDEGIAAVLGAATSRSAEGIARRLERAVLDHRAPGESDDVAIVVIRVPGDPSAGR